MATKAVIPFLVGMMLLTGVCNTLLTKYQVRASHHLMAAVSTTLSSAQSKKRAGQRADPESHTTGQPVRPQLR